MKSIYKLTNEETQEIQDLYDKKIAMENLFQIVANEFVYKQLVNDYALITREFNLWWETMSKKYQWEGTNWSVDFQTGDILLLE